ncbi:hypothetical protein [Anaerofustis sp.]|uniref:hypothetical protein n=1 Tax=Anaerofustis sp. TaxID=1872517 RepID=UPI0025BDD30C|nr:hypothetical protein [Anaerofustis sp.]
MMKKVIVFLTVALTVITFAGCSININVGDDQQGGGNPSNKESANVGGGNKGQNCKSTEDLDEIGKKITDFEKEVKDIGKSVDKAKAGSSRSDNIDKYSKLSSKIKKVETEIDMYDDDMELLFREGSLCKNDYRSIEKKLDMLDDDLGYFEDKIEYIYGIDD